MGQKPADIEREIAGRREAISQKLHEIDSRVRRDVDDIKERVPEKAEVAEAAGTVATRPDRFLREHPGAMVGVALGAGFVLDRFFSPPAGSSAAGSSPGGRGYAAGNAIYARPQASNFRSPAQDEQGDGNPLGFLASIPVPAKLQETVTSFLSELGDMLADEAKRLMKDATESIRHELLDKKADNVEARPASEYRANVSSGPREKEYTGAGSPQYSDWSGANGISDTVGSRSRTQPGSLP